MFASSSPAKLPKITALIIVLLISCAEFSTCFRQVTTGIRRPNDLSSARGEITELTCDFLKSSSDPSVFVALDEFKRSIRCVPDEERIIFLITRGWESHEDKNEAFLEALFISNPHSKVFFVSMTAVQPSTALFNSFLAQGYYIKGHHISCNELVRSGWFITSENKDWLKLFCGKPSSEYFYTHLTDYMRFTLLYLYGGMYTDTDSIFLQSIPSGEFIGLDVASPDVKQEPPPPWAIDPSKNLYAAPGVLRLSRGSTVAKYILENTFSIESYDPRCFNCVGPKAMNLALKAVAEKDNRIQILETSVLYPLHFFNVHEFFAFNGTISASLYLRYLMRSSVAIHLFGKVSSETTPDETSPYALMRTFFSLKKGSVPASNTLPCAFGGTKSLIGIRKSLRLNNANVVFLRDCTILRDNKIIALFVNVKKGRIVLRGRDFGNEAHFRNIETLAQINQVMSDIEYQIEGLRDNKHDVMEVRVTAGNKIIAEKRIRLTMM